MHTHRNAIIAGTVFAIAMLCMALGNFGIAALVTDQTEITTCQVGHNPDITVDVPLDGLADHIVEHGDYIGPCVNEALAIPACHGRTATVYVNIDDIIVGGDDDGKAFKGNLYGTKNADVIVGTFDDDTIFGRGGDDTICGSGGNDKIHGDNGNDTIFGEEGDDDIDGGGDADELHGGFEADIIKGGTGDNILCGEEGDDVLDGGVDSDRLDGGEGTDDVDGKTGTDTCANGEAVKSCETIIDSIQECDSDQSSSSSSSSSDTSSTSSSSSTSLSSSSASSQTSSATSSSSSVVSSSNSSSSSTTSSSSSISESSSSDSSSLSSIGISSSVSSQSISSNSSSSTPESIEVLRERLRDAADTPSYPLPGGYRGRSLGELSTVLDFTLQSYDLTEKPLSLFNFNLLSSRSLPVFTDDEHTDYLLREHAACCSMYRYLKRLREERMTIEPGYIDWLAARLANVLGQEPEEIKAALLGYGHAHPNANGFVRSITEAGCAENPFVSGFNWQPEMAMSDHEHTERLSIRQIVIDGEIAFEIMDGDNTFDDFSPGNATEMHMIVIRDDLRHFAHIHASRDGKGIWRVPYMPPAGGRYWIYADFIDANGKEHSLHSEKTYDGPIGEYGITPLPVDEQQISRNTVALDVDVDSKGAFLTLRIKDPYGGMPRMDKYRGYLSGHAILLAPSGAYVHEHPSPAGDAVTFRIEKPFADFYRIFTEFTINGEDQLSEFDWVSHR